MCDLISKLVDILILFHFLWSSLFPDERRRVDYCSFHWNAKVVSLRPRTNHLRFILFYAFHLKASESPLEFSTFWTHWNAIYYHGCMNEWMNGREECRIAYSNFFLFEKFESTNSHGIVHILRIWIISIGKCHNCNKRINFRWNAKS